MDLGHRLCHSFQPALGVDAVGCAHKADAKVLAADFHGTRHSDSVFEQDCSRVGRAYNSRFVTKPEPATPTPRRAARVLMILDNPCRPDPRVLKEAKSLSESGWSVTIAAWDRTGALDPLETVSPQITIVRVSSPSRHRGWAGRILTALRYWRAVAALAKNDGFDVFHSHDLPDLPIGAYLSLRWRRPLVYDAHELYWLDRGDHRARLWRAVERVAERALLLRVDSLITVSDYLADYYRALHRNVAVVGNWYDEQPVDRSAGLALRARLGISPKTFCLSYVGAMGPERDLDLLLDYAAVHLEVAVVVAGSGGAAPAVEAAAARLPNLHFLGHVVDPRPIFGASDALYYALREDSPYSHIVSPNNLFLSVATRIPLITTPLGDAGRIVGNSGAGEILTRSTVTELERAVAALRDLRRRAEIDRGLEALGVEFSWQRAAANLLLVYDRLAPLVAASTLAVSRGD